MHRCIYTLPLMPQYVLRQEACTYQSSWKFSQQTEVVTDTTNPKVQTPIFGFPIVVRSSKLTVSITLLRLGVNLEFDNSQREILAQPGRHGGCGVRLASRTSPAAYWAGWAAALPLLFRRFATLTREWGESQTPPPAVVAFREACFFHFRCHKIQFHKSAQRAKTARTEDDQIQKDKFINPERQTSRKDRRGTEQ